MLRGCECMTVLRAQCEQRGAPCSPPGMLRVPQCSNLAFAMEIGGEIRPRVDRAARLREIRREIFPRNSCGRPDAPWSHARCQTACRGTHCFGRRKVGPRQAFGKGRLRRSIRTRCAGERRVCLIWFRSRVRLVFSITGFHFLVQPNIFDATEGQTAAEFRARSILRTVGGRAVRLPFSRSTGSRHTASQQSRFQAPLAARLAGLRVAAILAFFGVHPKKVRPIGSITSSRLGIAGPKALAWASSTRRKPISKPKFGRPGWRAGTSRRKARSLLRNTFFGWSPKKSPLL
jgi:hypothetical protein